MKKPGQIAELRKRGPATPEGKARALANLRPPWTSETAPKSPGRPTAAESVQNRLNEMQDYTDADIDAYLAAPHTTVSGRAAAQQWKQASGGSGTAYDRVTKAPASAPDQMTIRHEHEHRHTVDFDAIENELAAIVTRNRGRMAQAPASNGN